ncbi:MAG: zinc-binding dehydrogenase [Ectothiorhodospiraceae bacterium]|nr:zinc-binding dehydrogenase [Ectothiorhodospiraceae bacterium]
MKAIQIHQTGDIDVLKIVDIERPIPEKTQVLIKTSAIGVTYGDIMVQHGVYPVMPDLPATLGFECSGIVESVGEDVTGLVVGQSVAVLGTMGCYAEYVVADATMVMPVPDSIDKDLVAAFPITYLTAYHMLHSMGRIEEGQTVLVYAAAGGVGTAAIQLARLAGVNVIGLTSSDDKASYTKQQGAHHVINYKTEDVVQRVKELTNGDGVNLVLNSLAGNTLARDFEVLANMGQIIWFGFAAGYPQENLTEVVSNNFMKSTGIRTFTLYNIFENRELFISSFKTLLDYLNEGKIKPHIHEKLPLAEVARAHQLMESSVVKGRLVLKP